MVHDMTASTRRKATYITAGCVLLAAVGVRYGHTHVAVFAPGWTAQKLVAAGHGGAE
jgi:hypothetical protein